MAEGFKHYLIVMILVGLFAIAIINAGIMISEQNDFSGSIGDDPKIVDYRDKVLGNLTKFSKDSDSGDGVLSNSSITTSTSTPFVDSLGGIWKTVRVVPVTIWSLTFGLVGERILGDDKNIVLLVLGAILSITIIFAIIYLIATGDGR